MNLLKLFLPKENAQVVTELESWTVTWEVKSGWGDNTYRYSKVFIKEEDAQEFRKQLAESAKFIRAWINTDLSKN